MSSLGKIQEFKLETENWSIYSERLEQYLIANDVAADKKVPVLLTVIGTEGYELLHNLCTPVKPSAKSYDELVKILTDHLCPKPSVIAERY